MSHSPDGIPASQKRQLGLSVKGRGRFDPHASGFQNGRCEQTDVKLLKEQLLIEAIKKAVSFLGYLAPRCKYFAIIELTLIFRC